MKKPSIYISIDGVDPGWIVGVIARDIEENLNDIGYMCRLGPPTNYEGEEICHHMGYAYAAPFPKAKLNSVFVTHIDDSMKERELLSLKDKFDLFVAMSNQDRDYMLGLGFSSEMILSALLPVRKPYVKPVTVGIFSACYSDGRKNESWLVDFCRSHDMAGLINFVFIGTGWGPVVDILENLGCSFEWHCAGRKMEYEYEFQKTKLETLDYYIYLGFDGGAMGSLDAYGYGRRLALTNDSYHLDIPDVGASIDNKVSFYQFMDDICQEQVRRLEFFRENTSAAYTKKLVAKWSAIAPNLFDDESLASISKNDHMQVFASGKRLNELLTLKRKRYASLTMHRMLGSIGRSILRFLGQ